MLGPTETWIGGVVWRCGDRRRLAIPHSTRLLRDLTSLPWELSFEHSIRHLHRKRLHPPVIHHRHLPIRQPAPHLLRPTMARLPQEIRTAQAGFFQKTIPIPPFHQAPRRLKGAVIVQSVKITATGFTNPSNAGTVSTVTSALPMPRGGRWLTASRKMKHLRMFMV